MLGIALQRRRNDEPELRYILRNSESVVLGDNAGALAIDAVVREVATCAVVEQSHIAHAEATCSTSPANGVAACGKLLPLRVAIKEFARIGIEQVRTHSQACQMSSHLGTGCRHLQGNNVEACGLWA